MALAVACIVGYAATLIPKPASLLDAGLVGALVLYGVSPAASGIAMLANHAISV